MSVAISSRRREVRPDHAAGPSADRSRRESSGRSRRDSGPAVPYLRLVASSGTPVLEPDPVQVLTPDRAVEPAPVALIPAQRRVPAQHRVVDRSARPVGAPARRGYRPVRLTRRGRALVWLILVGAAIVAMALLAPASQAASPAGPPRSVTVHSGDTMWSIATTMLPRDTPNVGVERIRVLNHLADDEVFVGEQLLIPSA